MTSEDEKFFWGTKALIEARASLPERLRGQFEFLIDDYREAASRRLRKPLVHYQIIADLVLAGWRKRPKRRKTGS